MRPNSATKNKLADGDRKTSTAAVLAGTRTTIIAIRIIDLSAKSEKVKTHIQVVGVKNLLSEPNIEHQSKMTYGNSETSTSAVLAEAHATSIATILCLKKSEKVQTHIG